jgi:hypothetical protein
MTEARAWIAGENQVGKGVRAGIGPLFVPRRRLEARGARR